MSDEKPKTYRLPRVKNDAIIDIKVSGAFLKKCQHLLMSISTEMGEETVKQALERFKNQDVNAANSQELAMFIMLGLVSEIEKEAVKQKKIDILEVTPEQFIEMQKEMGITT